MGHDSTNTVERPHGHSGSENSGAAVVTQWMLKLANEIANQAEDMADNFRNVRGDTALRMFADGIRQTNKRAGFKP